MMQLQFIDNFGVSLVSGILVIFGFGIKMGLLRILKVVEPEGFVEFAKMSW